MYINDKSKNITITTVLRFITQNKIKKVYFTTSKDIYKILLDNGQIHIFDINQIKYYYKLFNGDMNTVKETFDKLNNIFPIVFYLDEYENLRYRYKDRDILI